MHYHRYLQVSYRLQIEHPSYHRRLDIVEHIVIESPSIELVVPDPATIISHPSQVSCEIYPYASQSMLDEAAVPPSFSIVT